MFERRAVDRVLVVLEDQARLDRVDFERVRRVQLRAATDFVHVLFESARAVETYAAHVAGHPAGREQSHQSVNVVAVQVRDEDARDLADVDVASEELMLRALAAVEEPDLAALLRPQRDARDVSRARRHSGTRSKKSNSQTPPAYLKSCLETVLAAERQQEGSQTCNVWDIVR